MDQNNKVKKRVVRLIGGIAFTIVFAIFAYISCYYAPHSNEVYTGNSDVPEDWETGVIQELFRPRQAKRDTETQSFEEVSDNVQPAPAEAEPAAEDTEPAAEEATPEEVLTPAALKAQEKGLPTPPDIDITEWQYMLVNPTHLLSSDYAPTLAYLNMTADDTDIRSDYDANRCPVDEKIAEALSAFTRACKDAGLPVYLSSGYRSYDEQMYLFNRKVSQGYTEEVAKTIVAYPGSSEHQSGLCCDITDYYHELKDSSLADTDTFKWLNEHCAEYGFILRYPEDKSGGADTITGVIYEPWHFRYVGVEAATYMKENNLCLEEFVELYE